MQSVEQIMKNIFSQPTAPFRENWVLNSIEMELKNLRVPFFKDHWGNIIAGVKGPKSLKNSKRVALFTHTDHPGFHIEKKLKENLYQARWFGGFPPKTFKSSMAIYNPNFLGKGPSELSLQRNFQRKPFFK